MKQLLSVFIAVLAVTSSYAAPPVTVTFQGAKSERTWPLAELSADLPSDWSSYKFLVLEFKASSSQRFDLALETPRGRYANRIGPFAGVWVRAAIPLRFYSEPPGNGVDLAATFNQPRNSYWINIHSRLHGSLTSVTGITVAMDYPVGTPTLEIRSVRLAADDPGDAVLEGKPLVDEFGQYTHTEWPRKVRSLDELQRQWKAEEASLQQAAVGNRDSYGGFVAAAAAPAKGQPGSDSSSASGVSQSSNLLRATGFFHVQQVDGRWWFVDPDGHLFFSTGVNGIGVFASTRVAGREDLFAQLPPAGLAAAIPSRGNPGASFYTWNLQRRFGDDWRAKWADLTTRRMNAWGFNTMHNWGATNAVEPHVPYALMVRGWQTGNSIMGMPDVYAPDFARRVEEAAASQLEPRKSDPWMLGYFIGNEPPWPGRESLLCDAITAGPESEIQKRLKRYLAEGDTPARRKEFVLAAFRVYVETINAATRKHDPNHLNLGIRFGSEPDDDVLKAARGFDVFSVNIYAYAPSQARLDRLYSLVQRPILIGEFHIGAPERGLAPGLVLAMDQSERAAGYRYYVEQCASHAAVVGAHWFQWLDEPVTSRNDGENYNIGLVDVTDQPYAEMVEAAKLTHSRLLEIHSGRLTPTNRIPKASAAGTPFRSMLGPVFPGKSILSMGTECTVLSPFWGGPSRPVSVG